PSCSVFPPITTGAERKTHRRIRPALGRSEPEDEPNIPCFGPSSDRRLREAEPRRWERAEAVETEHDAGDGGAWNRVARGAGRLHREPRHGRRRRRSDRAPEGPAGR